jgi:pentapeptide MXKDX repeat protein
MTITTRIVSGILAAALSFSLAGASAAFAGDPMSQDIDFRNGMSRGDGVRKDTMARDTLARDTVTRDTASRGPTKKDDGIRKYGISK